MRLGARARPSRISDRYGEHETAQILMIRGPYCATLHIEAQLVLISTSV